MLRKLLLVLSLALAPLAAHETPTINAVVSAAGIMPAVSPGGIATVWGLDFASAAAGAEGLPLPLKIGETRVTINGVECPLFYVSEFQINLQIPFETRFRYLPMSACRSPAFSSQLCCTRTA